MKIPAHARRVFKGIIYDVYQWPQEMYDGTSATFEMLKRTDTVLVIPVINGKILVSEQEQPDKPVYFSLLGGRADEDEKPDETAKRELLEEAGLQVSHLELWKVYEPFSKMDWDVYVYIAKDCQKVSEQKLDGGEKVTLQEVDFDQFMELLTSTKFWGGEIALDILRMKEHKEKLEEFKKKLFS